MAVETPRLVWIVQNLSSGGASIVGARLVPGQVVPLTIHLAQRSPLRVTARVLRRQVGHSDGHCAVSFERLTPEQSAAIAEVLAAEQETAAARSAQPTGPAILLVGRLARRIAALTRELATLGHAVHACSSPLDGAAYLLREAGIKAVVVDEKLMEQDGWSLLEFIRDCRPRVRRLVAPEGVSSFRLNLALRSGAAQAVFDRPFRAATMAPKLDRRTGTPP